jgi:hypothetical protein
MPREDVNIKVSSDVAEAVRLWKAMQEGPQQMANEMEAMGQKGKKSTKGITDELVGMVGKWASIAAAIGVAQKAMEGYFESQKKNREQADKSSLSVDESARRFYVQGGIRDAQSQRKATETILGVAEMRAVDSNTAFGAATQLVSSGFNSDDVTQGGVLDQFLQILNATNAAGGNADAEGLAKAMTQYMTANNMDLSALNVRKVGVGVQRLFTGTNLQIGNLSRFAPESATIGEYSGLGAMEQAALFSQFLDVTDEAKGATAFRSGVVSLATAGSDKTKQRGLEMLGLRPEDVDFQGESFFDVQRLLAERRAGLSGDQRNIADKMLFGQDGLTFANVLLNQDAIGEGRRRVGLTQDEQGFVDTLAIAEQGIAANDRRTGVLEDRAFFDEDKTITEEAARRQIRARNKLNGNTAIDVAAAGIDEFIYNRALNFTDAEGAAALVGQGAAATGQNYQPGKQQVEVSINMTVKDAAGVERPERVEVEAVPRQGGGNFGWYSQIGQ